MRFKFAAKAAVKNIKTKNINNNLGKRRSDQFVFRKTNRQILKEETSMNKIYKVVWSKVKHCYVVTSELAKRQTKGCGARSLRMATVSLGVAASLLCSGAVFPIFGESVAEAGSSNNTVTVTEDWSGRVIGGLGGYAPNSTDKFGGASTTATDPVYNNKVIIESGTITTNGNSGGVYGGYGRTGEVSYNSITINGGTIDTYVYNVFGGVSYVDSEASIHHNTVTINDGVVHASQYIRGGYSWASAVVNENKVIITGGRISSLASVVGGESYKGIAKDNEVTISGVQGGNYVYGGRTNNGKVTNNKVSVSGSETRVGSTVGGGSQSFNENTLIEKNEVTIENGKVYSAYGGKCDSGAQVNNNTVNVNGGTVSNYVYGGLSGYGKSVSSNKVFINNGNVGNVEYGGVYGGHAHGAESAVKNNVVTIAGGTVGLLCLVVLVQVIIAVGEVQPSFGIVGFIVQRELVEMCGFLILFQAAVGYSEIEKHFGIVGL